MRSNKQIVADHYAASLRGDIAGMMADVAPDAEWTEMAGFPCAGTWIGPTQIVEHVFKALGAAWDDYRMTPDTLFDAGDCIVATGSYSGTYKATGKAMRVRVAHVWRLADGKIVRFEQFTDTLLVARAMEAAT